MRLKQFINMSICDYDTFRVYSKEKELLLDECRISEYLKVKKPLNGIIKGWSLDVENWDYPILDIIIE